MTPTLEYTLLIRKRKCTLCMLSEPYERDSDEKSHLYRQVFVTDHEISKTNFPAGVTCGLLIVLLAMKLND